MALHLILLFHTRWQAVFNSALRKKFVHVTDKTSDSTSIDDSVGMLLCCLIINSYETIFFINEQSSASIYKRASCELDMRCYENRIIISYSLFFSISEYHPASNIKKMFCHTANFIFVCHQDVDLIKVLWKQDVDMGFSLQDPMQPVSSRIKIKEKNHFRSVQSKTKSAVLWQTVLRPAQ